MIIFNPNIPEAESRIQSEPIRNNFNALNSRTDQLTPSPTDPISTGVIIGAANKVYFEDNQYTPFGGAVLDLGDPNTGVSNFNSPGTFKEIIVFFKRDSFGVGTLDFVESVEQTVRSHSADTAASIINDINAQRQPDTSGVSSPVPDLVSNISPIDSSIVICSILVTNNGQTGQRGAIVPIFETDLIDIRPFIQQSPNTAGLEDHINAPTLAQAHPLSVITNSLIQTTSSIVSSIVLASDTVPVNNTTPFDPSALGYNPIVRFTSDTTITEGTVFQTARVLSVSGSDLILNRQISLTAGDQVIRGSVTLDKSSFDPVEDVLGDILGRDFKTGLVELIAPVTIRGDSATSSVLSLESFSGDGYIDIRVPSTGLGSISTNTWVLPVDEPVVGEVMSVESLASGVATLRWSSPSITTLQLAYDNTPSGSKDIIASDGYITISGTDGLSITSTGGVAITNNLVVSGAITGSLDASNIVGVVSVANGGTGQSTFTTPPSGKLLIPNVDGTTAFDTTLASKENEADTIVLRDGSGDFSANDITANTFIGPLSGNASTATTLSSTLSVDKGGTGTTSFTTATVNRPQLVKADGTSVFSDILATEEPDAYSVVLRDSSGNFSANTITASLTGNASSATTLSSTLPIATGGTGATDASTARDNLGLGSSATQDLGFFPFRTEASDGSYVLALTDQIAIGNPGISTTVTYILPESPTFFPSSKVYMFKNIGDGDVKIQRSGTNFIEGGVTEVTLSTGDIHHYVYHPSGTWIRIH